MPTPGPLPPEITHALREAFGDAPIADLAVMTGGRSGATLLSLRVEGRGYVLRRSDPSRPGHAIRSTRELGCVRIASDRGVAPRLVHLDEAHGVIVMERVDAVPGARRPDHVASTLRRLHDGPPFPTGRGSTAVAMVAFASETLRGRGRPGLPGELLRTMSDLAKVTRRHAETAPCHNDLNPSNLLATAEAVYFVDWETAGQGDPFFDLGELGVFAFTTPETRAALLEAYVGRTPTDEERARAEVGRVMALGFFAAAFMLGAGEDVDLEGTPLTITELLPLLATHRASHEVAAAALFGEMRRSAATDAFRAARDAL
ncbi:MAG: phosphotransferase [Polyangiaceae bacterium]|jgi:aminoglycoside phosphotransferase (APT) family kinase protein